MSCAFDAPPGPGENLNLALDEDYVAPGVTLGFDAPIPLVEAATVESLELEHIDVCVVREATLGIVTPIHEVATVDASYLGQSGWGSLISEHALLVPPLVPVDVAVERLANTVGSMDSGPTTNHGRPKTSLGVHPIPATIVAPVMPVEKVLSVSIATAAATAASPIKVDISTPIPFSTMPPSELFPALAFSAGMAVETVPREVMLVGGGISDHGLDEDTDGLLAGDTTPAPVLVAGAAVEDVSQAIATSDKGCMRSSDAVHAAIDDLALRIASVTFVSSADVEETIDALREHQPTTVVANLEAIMADPTLGPLVGVAPRVLPDNQIVFTRTSGRRVTSPPPSPAADFNEMVTKKVDAIVQPPVVHNRREKTTGPISLPRCSRRIAKLPPELDRTSATTVCRKLGLVDDDGCISDEALDWYSKFYRDLPNRDHIEALAALFGWVVPHEVPLGEDSASVTVH